MTSAPMRLLPVLVGALLVACGRESPPAAAPLAQEVTISPTTEFNKEGEDVTGVAYARLHPENWEPYTEPITTWKGYRLRQSEGALPDVVRVMRTWKSGATRTDDLTVAPGGYVLEDEHRVFVMTSPPKAR